MVDTSHTESGEPDGLARRQTSNEMQESNIFNVVRLTVPRGTVNSKAWTLSMETLTGYQFDVPRQDWVLCSLTWVKRG